MSKLSQQFPWLQGVEDWADDVNSQIYGFMAQPVEDQAMGLYEGTRAMGQDLLNTSAAGLGALTSMPYVGREKATEALQRRLTTDRLIPAYKPQSDAGNLLTGAVETAEAPLEAAGQIAGDWTLDKTGSPLLATMAQLGPDAAAEVLATKGAGSALKGITPDASFTDIGATGPRRKEAGAVKLRTEPGPNEKYDEDSLGKVQPMSALYESPVIDETGRSEAFVPNRTAQEYKGDATFIPGVTEALRRTNRKTGTAEHWRKEFNRSGVADAELRFTGIGDILKSDGQITRDQIIDAYNAQGSSLEAHVSGEGVIHPRDKYDEAYTAAQAEQTKAMDESRNMEASGYGFTMSELGSDARVRQHQAISSLKDEIQNNHGLGNDDDYTAFHDHMVDSGIPRDRVQGIHDNIVAVTSRTNEAFVNRAKIEDERNKAGNIIGGPKSKSGIFGSYSPGNEIAMRRTAIQMPRTLFDPEQPKTNSHWSSELNPSDSVHMMHTRSGVYPVMSDPVVDRDDGTYRNTVNMLFESQSDPGQKWSGNQNDLAKTATDGQRELAMAEVKRLQQIADEKEKVRVDANKALENAAGQSPMSVFNEFPGAVDNILNNAARNNGFGEYHQSSSNPDSMSGRAWLAIQLQDHANPIGVSLRSDFGQEMVDSVIQWLPRMNQTFSPEYQALNAEAHNAERDVLNAQRKANDGSKPLHENMPFIQSRRERTNATLATQMDQAIQAGEEYIATIPQRMHGEIYAEAYAEGGSLTMEPEQEALDRFAPSSLTDSGESDVYYDEDRGEYYARDENGDWDEIASDDIPEDVLHNADANAPSYSDWYDEAREAYENENFDNYMSQNYTEVDGYRDIDGDMQDSYTDAVAFNRDQYEYHHESRPERDEFEEGDEGAEEYDEAVGNWESDRDDWAENNAEYVSGYTNDHSGEFYDSESDMREDAEQEFWEDHDNSGNGDYALGDALGEHWDERLRSNGASWPKGEAGGSKADTPWDEPMGPIDEPSDADWGKSNHAQRTKGAGQTYYNDALTVTNQRRFLRNLGLSDDQILEAMQEIEVGVGWGDRTSAMGNAPRKMRTRAIKITDAVRDAWENRERAGGLFGRQPMSDRSQRDKKAYENRGRALRIKEQGNLTMDKAREEVADWITKDIREGSKPKPTSIGQLFWDEEALFPDD